MPPLSIVTGVRQLTQKQLLPEIPSKWVPQFTFGLQAYALRSFQSATGNARMTAVLAAEQLAHSAEARVDGILAASLSLYWGEERLRRSYTAEGTRTGAMSMALQHALSELVLPELACPVQLYVGAEEIEPMLALSAEAALLWPQAEIIKPPCAHNILDETYINALGQNAGRLATAGLQTQSPSS